TFHLYNAHSDSWHPLTSFPLSGRSHSSITSGVFALFVFAGLDSNGTSHNDLWRYNTWDSSWVQLNSLTGDGRRGGFAFGAGASLYYTTGIDKNDSRLRETWRCNLPIGMEEIQETDLVIYPNPASDRIRIHGIGEDATVCVLNLKGQLVRCSEIGSEETLDVSELSNGIYLLIIEEKNSTQWLRLTIE
ncbi:MAG: T9SS type A sorting domain-containing protein, partial [Schleiferiaceae bacterium]|nr:T9SS type A sorting domain-containing protein [Schleiferiaceae bacterium]